MEKLTKNPLFYTSLVLAVLLGFQTYSLVFSAYIPPAGPPPTAGNVYQPLDTGSRQVKSGNLLVGTDVSGPSLEIGGTGLPVATFKESSTSLGKIYLSNGKLYVQATGQNGGAAFEIGTGTGASIGWTAGANNAIYNSNTGNVGIGVTNPPNLLTVAGPIQSTKTGIIFPDSSVQTTAVTALSNSWTVASGGNIFNSNSGNVGIGTNSPTQKLDVLGNLVVRPQAGTLTYYRYYQTVSALPANSGKMGCELTPDTRDCSLTTEIATSDAYNPNVVKYDEWTDFSQQPFSPGEYDLYKMVQEPTTGLDGNVTATDINLTNPQWSDTGGDIAGSGSNYAVKNASVDAWAQCPNGYFVSAIRFGTNDGRLTPVVRCSKL